MPIYNPLLFAGENVSAGSSVSEDEDEPSNKDVTISKGDADGVTSRTSRSSRSASAAATATEPSKD